VAPRAALADPFVVTSGSIVLFGPGATFQNGSLSFQGPGLDAGVVAAWFPAGPVFSFFADDTVDMSTTVTPGGWGVATVGSSSFGEVNFGGSLRFTATPFVAHDTGATSMSTLFTMTGELTGHFRDDPGQLAFSIQLVGQGTMSIIDLLRLPAGEASGRTFFSAHRGIQLMSFQEVTPVPEPGTMLLFASGAAAIAASAKRRKRNRPSDEL
jgi:hypothetical protein